MKSSFLPKYEQNVVKVSALYCGTYIFLFILANMAGIEKEIKDLRKRSRMAKGRAESIEIQLARKYANRA